MTAPASPQGTSWDRTTLPEGDEKKRAVRDMFDAIAPRYDLVNRIMTFRLDVRWRRITVRSLRLPAGARVLDLGAGTGDLCIDLRKAGYAPLAFDLSHGMLLQDRSGAPRCQADILHLPVPDACADGVTCGFTLRNLTDLAAFFGELGRVVRPGGRIALLDVGVPRLIEMRVTGFLHNLLNVLVLLGLPLSVLGVISIPFVWPSRSLRPLAYYSLIAFLFTCLVFPVATTWGTFLHAAGPVHVWLVIGALLLLDAVIARVGVMRSWTRPVAWLGPALAIFGSVLFSLVLLPAFGGGSVQTRDYYAELGPAFEAAAVPLDDSVGPVISDFPIWLADTQGIRSLALPDEPAKDVFDLSRRFPGTRYVVMSEGDDHQHWPEDVDAGVPWSECFREIDIGLPPTRVFEIVCR